MKRSISFARLVGVTLLRDPLSYLFCIGTPTGMLLLFYTIYANMPTDGRANMLIFRPDVLTPGIAFFGFTFVMLLGALLVSRDRGTAFLDRLRATPLRTIDFLAGYIIPLFLLGVAQCVLTFGIGAILCATLSVPLSFGRCLLSILSLLPALIFFICLGIGFGSILSATAAPGITSLLITLAGMMGGVWMPIETMPKLERVFAFLPFLHMVRLGRGAALGGEGILLHLVVTLLYTVPAILLPVFLFPRALKKGK